jgi:hypothetical protein
MRAHANYTIGLDIAKNVFQVHGIDAAEKVIVRKQLRRAGTIAGGHRDATMILVAYRHGLSEGLGKGTTASVEPKSGHTQLDCGPDPSSPALRASSASFVKIFFPAMRPDSQAPVI